MNETATQLNQNEEINTNPFSRTFKGMDLLFKYNQVMAIIILIASLIGGFLQFLGNISGSFGGDTGQSEAPVDQAQIVTNSAEAQIALIVIIVLVILVALCIAAVIGVYFDGITKFVAYKSSKKSTTNFSEAVKVVTSKFWTILAINIITYLKIVGGLLLFIIPGIRAALRYELVLYPVFDENLGASAAIKRSKQISKNHLMEIFGIVSVGTIIPIVGPLLNLGGELVMYPELKHLADSGETPPKVHWLNYIGLILLTLFVGTVVLIALLIASIAS